MIRGKCPICRRVFQTPNLDAWPSFPFCSERCRLVDLGRWIDGDYMIPGKDGTAPTTPTAPDPDTEE